MIDENNFKFLLGEFQIVMENGELTINDTSYEYNADDPIYALVRWVAARING